MKTQIKRSRFVRAAAALSVLTAMCATNPISSATDGHFLHGIGPINQSMGGAGTAAILDPLGMLKWNPAGSVSFEKGTLIEGSLELFIPDRTLYSEVRAGAFGPGFPAFDMSGSTRSRRNVALLPSLGIVHKLKSGKTAFHFGTIGAAGFGVEYPQDNTFTPTSNAMLTDMPPSGVGFGRIKSSMALLLMPIGLSHQVNDKLDLGFSVIPAFSSLEITPAPFAVPDDANGDGVFSYPRPNGEEWAYGIGAQIGVLYKVRDNFQIGASVSSPTWFTRHTWDEVPDEAGNPRQLKFRINLPMHVSVGFAWEIVPGTLLAADARWFNYSDTDGYKAEGFNPDGSVAGFGWDDIFAFGVGLQQDVGERFKVRVGYNYGGNPVPSHLAFFNSPCPAIAQHHVTAGVSFKVNEHVSLHAAFYHVFKNTESGRFHSIAGPVPDTLVSNSMSEDSVSLGVIWKF